MLATWRWFGPHDIMSLAAVCQAGAQGAVTALHEIPAGQVWPEEEIAKRQGLIANSATYAGRPLSWEVVESLPVSEEIKRQSGSWREHIENFKLSMANLGKRRIKVICYNFMPILDWTRTDLAYAYPNGATCMRFDHVDFAMFDIHVLEREGAAQDYDGRLQEEARRRFAECDDATKRKLVDNLACGLPGSAAGYSLAEIRAQLELYRGIDETRLRQHQHDFLAEVAPVAQEMGLRLCCHPDDPPVPLLGLPRVMSTEKDYQLLIDAVDVPANGITFCSGSLGARADNDLPGMMGRLGDRVHFLHLRNVLREHEGNFGSFHEAEHLEGSTDMPALLAAVLAEEDRRKEEGRADLSIPYRPDHGQDILDDLGRGGQPGYPAIGRLKGLAELKGIIGALRYKGLA